MDSGTIKRGSKHSELVVQGRKTVWSLIAVSFVHFFGLL